MPDNDSTLVDNESDNKSLLGRTSPMLSYFCIYNPSLGQSEENTKDQILYYTAKKVVPADVKMKQVGLAQALVNVTSTFSPSRPTENVHSQRNRMVFLQPEPGFWMHMCVELGILRRQIKDASGKEKLATEYRDTELNDQALSAVLKVGYEQFKLLNGTMTSILYGDDTDQGMAPKVDRKRSRSLMLAIEEFFSTWIWQWDFDRLDTMVFGAVFNGIPSQPILRSNYLDIHDLDLAIQKQFNSLISHLLVLDDEGSLIYRSPSLQPSDVRALRKYILKRVESHKTLQEEVVSKRNEIETTSKKEKTTSLKSLTKSLSQAHVFGYFASKLSTSTTTNSPKAPTTGSTTDTIDPAHGSTLQAPAGTNTTITATTTDSTSAALDSEADIPRAPLSHELNGSGQDSHHGTFLTGMVESTTEDLNGNEHTFTKSDIVRVYLESISDLEEDTSIHGSDALTEYVLVIFKDQSNLVWSFLLPSFGQDVDDLVGDIDFYHSLEQFMVDGGMDKIINSVWQNIEDGQKRSLTLGKHYKCFYYDNTTLNMKSTIVDQQGRVMVRTVTTSTTKQKQQFLGGLPLSNEMLLQVLNVKEDFDALQRTDEIYTRSTSNHWIVGKRVYSYLPTKRSAFRNNNNINQHADDDNDDEDGHEAPPDESPVDEHMPFDPSDYSEIYLVAAKKDVSLADVEDNIHKVTQSLLDILHCD